MAVPSVRPTQRQLDDLAAICKLDLDRLAQIRQRLDSQVTISRRKIQGVIETVISGEPASAVARFLMSAGVTMRRRSATPNEFVDGITRHLRSLPKEDTRFAQWDTRRPEIETLLAVPSVGLAAKAHDISYDFERVFTEARLITSIRPVFKEGEKSDKNDIIGSTVVQTLRLEYASHTGEPRTLSVALDLNDVESLRKSCVEAQAKAKASVALMEKGCQIEAIVIGEREE